jgi:hypothetical protein
MARHLAFGIAHECAPVERACQQVRLRLEALFALEPLAADGDDQHGQRDGVQDHHQTEGSQPVVLHGQRAEGKRQDPSQGDARGEDRGEDREQHNNGPARRQGLIATAPEFHRRRADQPGEHERRQENPVERVLKKARDQTNRQP